MFKSLLALTFFLVVVGCGKDNTPQPKAAVPQAAAMKAGWTDQIVQTEKADCLNSFTEAQCICILDKATLQLTHAEFLASEQNANSNEGKAVTAIIKACIQP